ncbi:MAG: HDIG domain-containing protein [Chloroflexi bacterium]|nr:HDIG domain-containing protein [Chloroflexota bacterium]
MAQNSGNHPEQVNGAEQYALTGPTADSGQSLGSQVRSVFQNVMFGLITTLFLVGTVLLLLFPIMPGPEPVELQVGDIAPETILAPYEVNYVSEIDLQEAEAAALQSVQDVYDPPDPRIGRQQVRRARLIAAFMRDVRADTFADEGLRLNYVDQVTFVDLPPDIVASLLTMSDEHFNLVEQEVVRLIQDAMSEQVAEGRVDQVTSQLELKVSTDLPDALVPVAVEMARDLIAANSIRNDAATEEARQIALDAIDLEPVIIREGEVVIRAGEEVTERHIEALDALDLSPAEALAWEAVASVIIATIFSTLVLGGYLVFIGGTWTERPLHLLVLVTLFLIFLATAQTMLPDRSTLAFLFPIAAFGLILTAIVNTEYAALSVIVLAALTGFFTTQSLELTSYLALSGILGAGSLRTRSRLNAFFIAGLFAALGGIAVLLVFRLPDMPETLRLVQLILFAVLNGLFSAGIALVLLFLVGLITGQATTLRMIDLMRPDNSWQRRLQSEALGTYNHTISVANLAEAAAAEIGADRQLVRVGVMYHDIGKLHNPGFFAENRNQSADLSSFEDLSWAQRARIIKDHVIKGVEWARKSKLPPQVIDFIAEHHGTMQISFFLQKAEEEAQANGGELTRAQRQQFFYDGPKPRSRETGITMLADACESAARAIKPQDRAAITDLVNRIVQDRIDAAQLDDSGLTFGDVNAIKATFVRALDGMYHPRIQYPSDKKAIAAPPTVEANPDDEEQVAAMIGAPDVQEPEDEVVLEADGDLSDRDRLPASATLAEEAQPEAEVNPSDSSSDQPDDKE